MIASPTAADERLFDARQELSAARGEFESRANDLTAEWVRNAQIRFEDSVALAQEWMVTDCPGAEIWV
jgi:hypothetical protein